MMKQGGDKSGGFTVVETLIVLAVTGALFVSAAAFINGRQAKTEFTVAINNLKQQIEEVINQTQSGYFANESASGSVICQGNTMLRYPSTPLGPEIAAAGTPGVTNGGCIFLGSALRFGRVNPGDFTVYPVLGNQHKTNASGPDVTSFDDAVPTIVGTGTGGALGYGDYSSVPAGGKTYQLQSGLTYYGAEYDGGPMDINGQSGPGTIAVIAILSDLGSYSFTGSALNSGAQQFGLYGFNGAPFSWINATDSPTIVELMNENGIHTPGRKSVALCFSSGTTNQSGLVTIGSASGGLSVTLRIFGTTTCS